MSLRTLALLGLVTVIAGLLVLLLWGHSAWQDFSRGLNEVERYDGWMERVHQMTPAIDYITLVRSDLSVIEGLSQDARDLASQVSAIEHSQARLARLHFNEMAMIGEFLAESTTSMASGERDINRQQALLMPSGQIRIHHAGAREAITYLHRSSMDRSIELLYDGLRVLLLATTVLALLVILTVLIIHRRLAIPIRTIDSGLKALSSGDMTARINLGSNDEFGELARSFNQMAEQRQQYEEELAQSENRFRELAENIDEVFWISDPETHRILYISPSFETLWGEKPESLYARPSLWEEAIHPDDVVQVRKAMEDFSRGQFNAEYRIIRPDGTVRWVLNKSTPVFDENGTIARIVGVARDITRRRTFQASLAERIKELRCLYRVLELTTIGNLTMPEIAEQIADLLPGSLQHETHAVARVEIGEVVHETGLWQQAQTRIGSDILIDEKAIGRVEVGYIPSETGQDLAFLAEEHALINGVTTHVARMVKSQRLNETLTRGERLKAIGELTGGIAHDFNNLLTVILGNAELLREQLEQPDPELARLADMAVTAAQRGADLTRRLLAFARRQALEPRALDLKESLDGMHALLKRTLGEDIDLSYQMQPDLWPALADPAQLESAILNLCLNARDAMPQGGRLTLEARNEVLDADYAASQDELEPGDYVMLAVSDTGKGMGKEHLDQVFQPFFTTKEDGTGLGLSMVYGLIKQLQGNVRIYSELDLGTTVRLYLKRADGDERHHIEQAPLSDDVRGHESILLVEDDELVRNFAANQLRSLGYDVLEASSGPQALMILRSHDEIDLLFTDIIMPGGMNGKVLADLAVELKPDIKVLFTSGYTENAIVHHGRLDPGVELLSKPYRRAELARRIRQVLNEHGGQRLSKDETHE
jgi:PAS domain S-box-containing protein